MTNENEIREAVRSFSLRVRNMSLRLGDAERLTGTEMRVFAENLMDACQKIIRLPDEYVVDVRADNEAFVELIQRIDEIPEIPDSPEGL